MARRRAASQATGSRPGRQYRHGWSTLNDYFRIPIAAIRPRHCASLRDRALRSRPTAASVSREQPPHCSRTILAWALPRHRPRSGRRRPLAEAREVRQRKGVVLTRQRCQALLRAFDDEQARLLFLTFVDRRAADELLALRWRDVDLIDGPPPGRGLEDRDGRAVDRDPAQARRGVLAASPPPPLPGRRRAVFAHPETGTSYPTTRSRKRCDWAFKAAGIAFPEGLRPATTCA